MCFICDMAKHEAALRSLKSNINKPEPKEEVPKSPSRDRPHSGITLSAIHDRSANQPMYPKYFKSVVNDTHIDVYRVHQLFNLNNEMLCHASKKLLLAGERTGEKSLRKDVIEARDTLNRYLELNP